MNYIDEIVRKLEFEQAESQATLDKDFVSKLLLVSKAYKYMCQELKLGSEVDSDITWVREKSIEVRNRLAEKYKEGTDFGYTNGYDAAYKEGSKDGYDSGYDDGFEDGEHKGYEKGYESGDCDGYNAGHEDGYAEGKKEGYNDGFTEGQNSGYFLGSTESTAVMKNKFKSLSLCKRLVIAFTGNLK